MTDATLLHRIDQLTQAVSHMASIMGTRLTQDELCQRLRISRSTLLARRREAGFPVPDVSGKWLLSDVLAWESRH